MSYCAGTGCNNYHNQITRYCNSCNKQITTGNRSLTEVQVLHLEKERDTKLLNHAEGMNRLFRALGEVVTKKNLKSGGSGAIAETTVGTFHVCTHGDQGYIGIVLDDQNFYFDFGKDKMIDDFIDRVRKDFVCGCCR